MSKTFTYSENGIAYTITVYVGEDGGIKADVTVVEGSMDVNAIYWGDSDFTGDSENLGGPLNMNGEGSQYEGESIQWDGAKELSRPGLRGEGENKETFLSEGQTLTIDLDVESLDEIDFIGIRATSVNGDGSIKGVSGDPEDDEPGPDPEPDPDPATYGKVFFVYDFDSSGIPSDGLAINAEEPEPNEFGVPFLPDGVEPTFENYVNYFEQIGGEVGKIESVLFYDENLEEIEELRLDPDEPFDDAVSLLAAYEAVSGVESNGDPEASVNTDDDPELDDFVSSLFIDADAGSDSEADEPEDLDDEAIYA